jgi:DNA-binding NarL/FixJ family response regulator
MTSVLLVDDQPLVRAGLSVLLEAEGDIAVTAEADGGAEAVRLAAEVRPDVVVMDIRMPGVDGLEATRQIVEVVPDARILILTTFELDEYIYAALRGGASGFLLKDSEPSELVRAIRLIAAGEAVLSPSVTRRLITEFASRPERLGVGPEQLDRLTEREREVMALVAAGLSNEEIASRLVVAPATAKTHVSRAMRKLGAHDRAQLVVLAYETGLVYPGHALAPPPSTGISVPAALLLTAGGQL